MSQFIASFKGILLAVQKFQNDPFILFFLYIVWLITLDLTVNIHIIIYYKRW